MKSFKSNGFFLRGIHFRKYVKFSRRENKKVSDLSIPGHLIRKGLPLFGKSLMTLENLHQTKL